MDVGEAENGRRRGRKWTSEMPNVVDQDKCSPIRSCRTGRTDRFGGVEWDAQRFDEHGDEGQNAAEHDDEGHDDEGHNAAEHDEEG